MPSRTRRTIATLAGIATLALVGTACGSSSHSSATTSTTGGTSSTSASTASPSTTTADQTPVSGPVPAVTGATDLSKEPTVAAGTGTPPTVLTDADLVVGTGATAAASDTVRIQYVGALYSTGKVFDASWTDSGPATFPLSGVVPGFRDAIVGMKVGGRREVVIPPALGYGAAGNGPVPANATLVFVIDLLSITS